ncbi:hypothetical protein MUG78_17235 [Gordonia alkaliphila]|uniref:hypothetical protein n=1 Tax=Gordonia alkaliphila TaxID=1053547 RepID=UPI001FF1C488|nr:hypothetical protein [Gordonia alkaliphila]MCK0441146.1 hypothetical protein [Gordonia alkaliphila]
MTTATFEMPPAPASPLATLALAADLDSAAERARQIRGGNTEPALVQQMAGTDVPELIREALRARQDLPAAYDAQRNLTAQLLAARSDSRCDQSARADVIALLNQAHRTEDSHEVKTLVRQALEVLHAAQ